MRCLLIQQVFPAWQILLQEFTKFNLYQLICNLVFEAGALSLIKSLNLNHKMVAITQTVQQIKSRIRESMYTIRQTNKIQRTRNLYYLECWCITKNKLNQRRRQRETSDTEVDFWADLKLLRVVHSVFFQMQGFPFTRQCSFNSSYIMKFNQSLLPVKLNEKREQVKQKILQYILMFERVCVLRTFMYILQSKFETLLRTS